MRTDYSEREQVAVKAIKKAIPAELKSNLVPASKGFFTELFECNAFPNHYLATAVDGVGTKIILAIAMQKYNTVGIDCVAMNANDMAVLGKTRPFLFLDYLACQEKIEVEGITGELMKGIVSGLELADCSGIIKNSVKLNLGKGETASLDELISSPRAGYGFDLAGCLVGLLEKKEFKYNVEEGMEIIALKSSGAHSNGYTALRHYLLKGEFEERKEFKKFYKGKYSLDDTLPEGNGEKARSTKEKTIGEALLEPTKIYSKTMAKVAEEFSVVGVNNTGYGLKNLNRLGKGIKYVIEEPLTPQPIFNLMQKESKFSTEKMYSTFNMGMGFFVIAKKEDSEGIISLAEKCGEEAKIVGCTEKSAGKNSVLLKKEGIELKGY